MSVTLLLDVLLPTFAVARVFKRLALRSSFMPFFEILTLTVPCLPALILKDLLPMPPLALRLRRPLQALAWSLHLSLNLAIPFFETFTVRLAIVAPADRADVQPSISSTGLAFTTLPLWPTNWVSKVR